MTSLSDFFVSAVKRRSTLRTSSALGKSSGLIPRRSSSARTFELFSTLPQAFEFFNSLLDDFSLARLNGKVRLRKGDLVFARIAILGDQIAGIAREHIILNGSLCSLSCCDHLSDVGKMILNCIACILTCYLCLFDNDCKIFPLIVAQQLLQIARIPKLDAILLMGMIFEFAGELFDDVGVHFFHLPNCEQSYL